MICSDSFKAREGVLWTQLLIEDANGNTRCYSDEEQQKLHCLCLVMQLQNDLHSNLRCVRHSVARGIWFGGVSHVKEAHIDLTSSCRLGCSQLRTILEEGQFSNSSSIAAACDVAFTQQNCGMWDDG